MEIVGGDCRACLRDVLERLPTPQAGPRTAHSRKIKTVATGFRSHPQVFTAAVSVFTGTPPTKPLLLQMREDYERLKRVLLLMVLEAEHCVKGTAFTGAPSRWR